MKAHYFKSKTEQYVILSEGFAPVGKKVSVRNKREARALATLANAEPHNF